MSKKAKLAKQATTTWCEGPAPKDGTEILAVFKGKPLVVSWGIWHNSWPEWILCGCDCGSEEGCLFDMEPERWALINLENDE